MVAASVMPAVMPTGVEHAAAAQRAEGFPPVMPAVMPTGVEHSSWLATSATIKLPCDARRDADRR